MHLQPLAVFYSSIGNQLCELKIFIKLFSVHVMLASFPVTVSQFPSLFSSSLFPFYTFFHGSTAPPALFHFYTFFPGSTALPAPPPPPFIFALSF